MSERIIQTAHADTQGNRTRSAYTPSEELGGSANTEDFHFENMQIQSPEMAEAAAYAAKPFMDVAATIYESSRMAIEREQGSELDAHDKTELMAQLGLRELVELGERHARKAEQAARMGSYQPRPMTGPESDFIDAMKVVADHAKAQATTDLRSFYSDPNPRATVDLVASASEQLNAGKANTIVSKLESLKHDTETYNEESHLLDTSDYALEDAGKAAIANQPLDSSEKMKLMNRVRALKNHTAVLELIGQRYNYDDPIGQSVTDDEEKDQEPRIVPDRNENIVNNAAEARHKLAHSPDLMRQLVDETDAFIDHSLKVNADNDRIDWLQSQARNYTHDTQAFREIISDWAESASTMSFEDYVEVAKDTAVDTNNTQEQMKLACYTQIKSNYFFRDRESALLKRMNVSRGGDGTTIASLGFEDVYFK